MAFLRIKNEKPEGIAGSLRSLWKREYEEKSAVVMGQKGQLFMELTANDTLWLFKEIYGIGERQYQETEAYFTELFDADRDVRRHQRGNCCTDQKRKLYQLHGDTSVSDFRVGC